MTEITRGATRIVIDATVMIFPIGTGVFPADGNTGGMGDFTFLQKVQDPLVIP
jgi:hypothetical protein